MATARREGDVSLDFRGKDFSKMTEKGVTDCSAQGKPIKLLELFGGIGAPRRALQNCGYDIKSIDYVEVLPYAVMAYNRIFECGPKAQDIRIWNMSPDIVVHGSPCFVGDTKILMGDGTYKDIEDIRPGESVSYNGKSYTVKNFWDQGVKDVITLEFNDGASVTCTPNHRFLTLGDDGRKEWVAAEQLLPQCRTIIQNDGSGKYVTNVLYPEPQNVYDIEVDEIHCFVLENGSIAHNCQDFSNEGKNDLNTGRSILFERVLQILDPNPVDGHPELSRQPKVVIWENVPRLLWSYKDILDYYVGVMEEFGYTSYYQILTASDYNIPQDRDRVFVVSVLNGTAGYDTFAFPERMNPKWTLRQFIDKTVDFNDPAVQLTDAEKSILSRLPDGTLTVKEGTKKGYKEVNEWQIINMAIPGSKNRRGRVGDNAKTITTAPRQAVYYNNQVRMLTAKEYLRLMGYKDIDYRKMRDAGITDKQIGHLAGNSICVPVLEAIFRKLAELGTICKPEETVGKTLAA